MPSLRSAHMIVLPRSTIPQEFYALPRRLTQAKIVHPHVSPCKTMHTMKTHSISDIRCTCGLAGWTGGRGGVGAGIRGRVGGWDGTMGGQGAIPHTKPNPKVTEQENRSLNPLIFESSRSYASSSPRRSDQPDREMGMPTIPTSTRHNDAHADRVSKRGGIVACSNNAERVYSA
jgi:hypothetical protein